MKVARSLRAASRASVGFHPPAYPHDWGAAAAAGIV